MLTEDISPLISVGTIEMISSYDTSSKHVVDNIVSFSEIFNLHCPETL